MKVTDLRRTLIAALAAAGMLAPSAVIAANLGGGGHRNAAGFTVSLDEWVGRFLV